MTNWVLQFFNTFSGRWETVMSARGERGHRALVIALDSRAKALAARRDERSDPHRTKHRIVTEEVAMRELEEMFS